MTGSAKQSTLASLSSHGLLRFARNDADNSDTDPHSRGASRPSCAGIFRPEMEGAGNAGCPLHPQPRVVGSKTHALVTTVAPASPGIPARDGVTAYFALSLVTGLSCHHRPQETCKKLASRELDASVGASGPHDFAVRKIRARQSRHLRPSHPNPTSVTIAKRPFFVGRDGNGYKTDSASMGSIISDFPKLFIAAECPFARLPAARGAD
jgi:hypothetical protein